MLNQIEDVSASNHHGWQRPGRSTAAMRLALLLLGAGVIGLALFGAGMLVAPLLIQDSEVRSAVLVVARWAVVGLIPVFSCAAGLAAYATAVAWRSQSPNRRGDRAR